MLKISKSTLLVFLLLLSACQVDYRSDRERNEGVTLTAEQIEIRKSNREARSDFITEGMVKDDDGAKWRRAMIDCWGTLIANCL